MGCTTNTNFIYYCPYCRHNIIDSDSYCCNTALLTLLEKHPCTCKHEHCSPCFHCDLLTDYIDSHKTQYKLFMDNAVRFASQRLKDPIQERNRRHIAALKLPFVHTILRGVTTWSNCTLSPDTVYTLNAIRDWHDGIPVAIINDDDSVETWTDYLTNLIPGWLKNTCKKPIDVLMGFYDKLVSQALPFFTTGKWIFSKMRNALLRVYNSILEPVIDTVKEGIKEVMRSLMVLALVLMATFQIITSLVMFKIMGVLWPETKSLFTEHIAAARDNIEDLSGECGGSVPPGSIPNGESSGFLPFAVSLIGVMFCLTAGSPALRSVSERMRLLGSLVTAGIVLNNLASYLWYLLPVAIKTCIIDKFGSKQAKTLQHFEDWQLQAEAVIVMSRSARAISDKQFQRKVRDLTSQFSEYDLTVLPRSVATKGTTILFKLLNICSILFNMANQSKSRVVPFSLHLAGPAGSGKTSTIKKIKEKLGCKQSYSVPKGEEFWSGCPSDVDFISWDEFLIGNIGEENVKKDARFYLQLISSEPVTPNFASLDDPSIGIKGTRIQPRVVLSCNNTLYNTVEGIDSDALARRRNFVINTRITPGAKMQSGSHCNVDLKQYTQEQIDNLDFVDYYIYPAQEVKTSSIMVSQPVKLPKLLEFIYHQYSEHMTAMTALVDLEPQDMEFDFDTAWRVATANVMNLPKDDSSLLGNVLDSSLKGIIGDTVSETNDETPRFRDVFFLLSEQNNLVTVCENFCAKGTKKYFSFPTIISDISMTHQLIFERFLEKYSLSQVSTDVFKTVHIEETPKQTTRYHLVTKKVKVKPGFPTNETNTVVSNGIYYGLYNFDSKTRPFGDHENFVLTKAARDADAILKRNVAAVRSVSAVTEFIPSFTTVHQSFEIDDGSDRSEEERVADYPTLPYNHVGGNGLLYHYHHCVTPNCSSKFEFIGNDCSYWTCDDCISLDSSGDEEFYIDDLDDHNRYTTFRTSHKQKPREVAATLRDKINNSPDPQGKLVLLPTYALVGLAHSMQPEDSTSSPWWLAVFEKGLSILTFVLTMFWVRKAFWACMGRSTRDFDTPMFINGEQKGSIGGEGKKRLSKVLKRWTEGFKKKVPVAEINGETQSARTRIILPGGSGFYVLPVVDGWVLCHGHWWYEHFLHNTVTVSVRQGNRRPFTYTLNPDNMVFMDSNDAIMINIVHPQWQRVKDSRSKFLTDMEYSSLDGFQSSYTDMHGVSHSGWANYYQNYPYRSKLRTYTCEFAFVGNYASEPGNCGLPVYVVTPSLWGRIVGVIVSGNTELGMCGVSALSQEMIDTAINKRFTVPEHTAYINSNFVSKGVVPKSQLVRIPRKTKLHPSQLAEHVAFQPQKQPAVLTDDDPRLEKGNLGPIVNAIQRLDDNVQVPVDDAIFNRVVKEQKINFDTHLHQWEDRELTMDEAVCGIPGKLSSIDLSTSPGYPWVRTCPGKKKSHWITINPDGSVVYRYGIDCVIRQAYDEIRAGILPEDYRWIGYMKDELVSPSKVSEGRTRIVYTGDFVYTIAFRMLYGGVLLRFNNTSTGTPLCIQQNQFSYDMNDIFMHLTNTGNHRFSAGDYKNFDQKMQRKFQEAAYDLFVSYSPRSIPPVTHKIFKQIQMDSTMQIDDIALRVQATHFSGCLLTTLVNCFVNELYFMYIFYTEHPTLNFNEEIRLKVMGDDNLYSSSDRVEFNALTMANNAHKIGQVYTSDVKNEPIVPYKPFEDLTFCGAHPRLMSNGKYTGAMRKSTLEETILWTRNDNTTLLSESIQMIEYASQWDQPYYENYKTKVEKALKLAGWQLYSRVTDYETVQALVSERTAASNLPYGLTYINSGNITDISEPSLARTAMDMTLGVGGAVVGTIALFFARKLYQKVYDCTRSSGIGDPELPDPGSVSTVPVSMEQLKHPTFINMHDPSSDMQSVVLGSKEPETQVTSVGTSPSGGQSIGQSVIPEESLMQGSVLRAKVVWKNSHSPATTIGDWSLPGDLLRNGDNHSYQTTKFSLHQYWRGTMVITVTVCAPEAASGCLCLCFNKMQSTPCEASLMELTARPHVMIPAVTGTNIYSLTIPFDYYSDFFPLNKGYTTEQTCLGRLSLVVYGRYADLTTNETTAYIYSSFKDNQFMLTRTPKLFTHGANVSTSNYTYDVHDISGTVTTQNRSAVDQKTSAQTSATLPLDRPILAGGSVPQFTKNLSYSNTDGPDVSNIMSTKRCHMEMEHFDYETNESDIAYMCRLPATLFQYDISKTTPLGDLFTVVLTSAFTDNIGPNAAYHKMTVIEGAKNEAIRSYRVQVPHQTAILGQFEFWKADIVFRLIAIKNKAHSFTLKTTYLPNIHSMVGEEKECYCNAFLKFTGDCSIFDVRVPWKSPYSFLHTFDNTGSLLVDKDRSNSIEVLNDQSLGLFVVELIGPLVCPTTVVERISLSVQVWMENVEVCEPKPNDSFAFISPLTMSKQNISPTSAIAVHYNNTDDTTVPDTIFDRAAFPVSQSINSPPPTNKLRLSDLTTAEQAARSHKITPLALKYYVRLDTEIMMQTDISMVTNYLEKNHPGGPALVVTIEECKAHPYLISVKGKSVVPLEKTYLETLTSYWKGKVMTSTEYSVSLERHGEVNPRAIDKDLITVYTSDTTHQVIAYRCNLCVKTMRSDNEYHQHLTSKKHLNHLSLSKFLSERSDSTPDPETTHVVTEVKEQPFPVTRTPDPDPTTQIVDSPGIESSSVKQHTEPDDLEIQETIPKLADLFDDEISDVTPTTAIPVTVTAHDQSVSDSSRLETVTRDISDLVIQDTNRPVYVLEGSLLLRVPMDNAGVRARFTEIVDDDLLWTQTFTIGVTDDRCVNFVINITPRLPLSYDMTRSILNTKLSASRLWYFSLKLPLMIINSGEVTNAESAHNTETETSISMGEMSNPLPVRSYSIYPNRPMVAPIVNFQELNRRYTLLSQDDTKTINGFHSSLTWRTFTELDFTARGPLAKAEPGYYSRKGSTVKIFHLGSYGILPHFYRCMGGSLTFRFKVIHSSRPEHPSIVVRVPSIGEMDTDSEEKISLLDTIVTNAMDVVSQSSSRVRMARMYDPPSTTSTRRVNFLMGTRANGGCPTNANTAYEIFNSTSDPFIEECTVTVPLVYTGRRFPLYLSQRKTLGSLTVIGFSSKAAIVASVAAADDFTYSSLVMPDQCYLHTFQYVPHHATTTNDRIPFTSGGMNLNYQ